MKYRLLLLILLPAFQLKAVDMNTVRDLFASASESSSSCNKLYSMTASGTLSKDPILYAYHAAAEMTKANHSSWPHQKLGHFNAVIVLLENVIAKYPKDVEMRYIRYCVQRGCPFFLGYSSNKASDKKYVLANMDKTDWSDSYKKKVRDFLNSQA